MNDNKLKQILSYTEMGWRVLPIHFRKDNMCSCGSVDCSSPLKHPTFSSWDEKATDNKSMISARWEREPRYNVGILTGKKSNLVVLDIDNKEGQNLFNNLSSNDPETVISKTGSGGRHYFYLYDEGFAEDSGGKISNKVRFLDGMDIRAEGGFVVAPPSEHNSGNFYEWINSPKEFQVQPLPEWLKDAIKNNTSQKTKDTANILKDLNITKEIPHGRRNDVLFRLSAALHRNFGFEIEDVKPVVENVNDKYCNPSLPKKEIEQICLSGCGYLKKDDILSEIEPYELSDVGNGKRIADMYGDVIRFDHSSSKWYIWNSKQWKLDEKKQIINFVEDAAETIKDLMEVNETPGFSKACFNWHRKSRNNAGLRNALDNASAKEPIASTAEDFDEDVTYFNLSNGCFNTKTFEILNHEDVKDKMITKISNVNFDKNAKCDQWLKFLNEIFDNEKELIKYVQKSIGYTLTGEMREQGFYFLHGDGSNGKSTFLNIILRLMDDYGKKADINTFMKKPNESSNGNTNDLAELKGIRYIMSSEPEAGSRFSMSRLKQWASGNERIKARFLFKEFIEFYPVGIVWIAGNEYPKITEKNFGAWRRVKLIPFTVQIPEERQDLDLENKLIKELSGILNWCIEGLKLYRDEGLVPPEKVKSAIEAYKNEMDSIAGFISYHIEFVEGSTVSNIEFCNKYKEFCQNEGFRPQGNTKVIAYLEKDSRFEKGKMGSRVQWKGIKIVDENSKEESNEIFEEGDIWGG